MPQVSEKTAIHTNLAPDVIGTYSQALRVGQTVYLSGQIPLVPETMQVLAGDLSEQCVQTFTNLKAVVEAAGGTLSDIVKLTIYLLDLTHFDTVNTVMGRFFSEPYPARAAIGVAALPKNVPIEVEGVMILPC